MWHRPAFQVTPAWLDSDPRGFFAAYPKGRSDVRLSSGPSVSSQAGRGSYHPTNEEHWAVLSLQASCSPLLIGLVTPVGPCPPVPPGRPESSLLLSSAPEEPEEPLKSGQAPLLGEYLCGVGHSPGRASLCQRVGHSVEKHDYCHRGQCLESNGLSSLASLSAK